MSKMSPWVAESNPCTLRRTNKIIEECAEVIKICARINMQGLNGVDPATKKPNRQAVEEELADVYAQIHCIIRDLDLDKDAIARRGAVKVLQMEEWDLLVQRPTPN